jgi:mannosyl-oligosaccharide alpha-1,2-mannosidase
MISLRRTWLLPGVFITILIYFIFFRVYPDDTAPRTGGQRLHWAKRPERYPVTELKRLPPASSKSIPRIQFDFSKQQETIEEQRTREERKAKVKESFQHTWAGYKKYAWGRDEVGPMSGTGRDSFGGWGATLVDTLDTLYIMGLQQDFDEAVKQALLIDFTTNTEMTLNVFETTIRYLGGLMAAFDIGNGRRGDLLAKAKDLGDILYSAFDTPNRMPQCRWEWRKTASGGNIQAAEVTLLAEFGSLSLEFTRLSQLTGDPKYYDAVQRITEHMATGQNSTHIPGLWPTVVNAKDIAFDYNHFTLGGMADSTYEYLPKEYLLLGGSPEYEQLYITALKTAKRHLFFRPMIPGNTHVLFSGNAALSADGTTTLEAQGQHLTCFAAGMVAIGSRIFSRPEDLDIAKKLLEGCIWAYSATPSGLMPETFHLVPCAKGPDALSSDSDDKCIWDDDKWYEAITAHAQATNPTSTPGALLAVSDIENGKLLARQKHLTPGFIDIGDPRYILRPETIESVFILYRITGERRYMDIAWTMFVAIEKATRTDVAFAAVSDVRVEVPGKSDRMESFWLAETLKYFYLVFSDEREVSLDEFVLNTEAHPFRRPR